MKKPAVKKEATVVKHPAPAMLPVEERVRSLMAELKRLGSEKRRGEMAARYGIVTDDAFGVAMGDMQKMAKRAGRDHALAAALWETGNYEARMLAALVDEPAEVTAAQMDQWCADFDNWAICDTVCFQLFDRTPHAFSKVEKWSRSKVEFVRRGAFALLASLALHDKKAAPAVFAPFLSMIEAAATDDRNFVKKAVNWALRSIGGRNAGLHQAALAVAERLAASTDRCARWVGSDAVRQLSRAVVLKRLAKRG
ncbi:MAG TPA: DNA alkylation repair protein [Verrucomicrobiales bacterium]|nr:DNA alkylation repair protein [Verrucomicrobiales bacterium]